MQIEINFRVFKKLTALRPDERTTYDDVLCDLLKISREPKGSHASSADGPALVRGGVEFPSGTALRTTYKGRVYNATIIDGKIVVDGIKKPPTSSFSKAASYVTDNNVNGWGFWQCKRPQDGDFKSLRSYRK